MSESKGNSSHQTNINNQNSNIKKNFFLLESGTKNNQNSESNNINNQNISTKNNDLFNLYDDKPKKSRLFESHSSGKLHQKWIPQDICASTLLNRKKQKANMKELQQLRKQEKQQQQQQQLEQREEEEKDQQQEIQQNESQILSDECSNLQLNNNQQQVQQKQNGISISDQDGNKNTQSPFKKSSPMLVKSNSDVLQNEDYIKSEQQDSEWIVQQKYRTSSINKYPIKVINSVKTQKSSAYQVLQQLLNWIFTSEGVNPLWLLVQNKSKVKHFVYLQIKIENAVDFENMLKMKKLSFLSSLFLSEQKVAIIKDNYLPIQKNFWYSVFAQVNTQKKIEELLHSNKKVKQFPKNQQQAKLDSVKDSFTLNNDSNGQDEPNSELSFDENQIDQEQQMVYQKEYEKLCTFVLDSEELYNNLYPQPKSEAFKNYVKTSESEIKLEDQPRQNTILSLDCEMVRTDKGCLELARVTLINYEGEKLIDQFVKPANKIIDYNTQFSGITYDTLKDVKMTLEEMQKLFLQYVNSEVILIGHSLENDLNALRIMHFHVVDTSVLFLQAGRKQSLKNLSYNYLNMKIQQVTHDSLEDAMATLNLVKLITSIYENGKEMKDERQVKFRLMDKINKENYSVMIVDNKENIDQLFSTGVHYDDVEKTSDNYKEILQKMLKWISCSNNNSNNGNGEGSQQKEKNNNNNKFIPNVLLAKIQKNKQEYQTQYSFNIDSKIKEMYEQAPENTIFMIHFETSCEQHKSFSLSSSPYCIFFNK